MKKYAFVLLVSVSMLCSCEKEAEAAAIAFGKIPDTNIAESQLGTEVYTYDGFLSTTAGRYYDMEAIYDCYEKKGETYYIMKRKDNYPDNANQLVGTDGTLPAYKQFHDGYYSSTIGEDRSVKLYDYTFDEATQSLNGIYTYVDYADFSHVLVYLSEDYFVLQIDAPWSNRSKELGATFSRVVYKQCLKSEVPIKKDTLDLRNWSHRIYYYY